MHNARFHDATNDGSDEGYREGVINVELERSVHVVLSVMRQDIHELADEIKRLACHVRDLEDGTYPLADELCCCVDAFLAVLDEDGDFAGSWRFEDFGELCDGLLQDLGRTDVDFSDDDLG